MKCSKIIKEVMSFEYLLHLFVANWFSGKHVYLIFTNGYI